MSATVLIGIFGASLGVFGYWVLTSYGCSFLASDVWIGFDLSCPIR